MPSRRVKNTHYLVIGALALLALVVVIVALQPRPAPIYWLIRGAALLGYLTIFLSILSSAYLIPLVRFFGRPFIKVHHVASITGLVAMLVHPIAIAINAGSLSVFVPQFASLRIFLTLAGRVVWPLAAIAALAAWLRKPLGKNWRLIHYLNYLAFWLVTAHAILIGSNFQGWVMRGLAIALALITVAVLIVKRLPRKKKVRR
jgi:DMSO/TMAO reductase YedYZ heme-binding membrane subunit